jgi:DNA-binding response OmpR family regulator
MGADILSIDDEPGMLDLIRLVVKKQGLTVEGASSGEQGLAIMRESPPKVVLLDIMMPEMDGWDVFKQMKEDAALKDIPVIIVTARKSSLEEIIARTRAGVDEYIIKPFSPARLRTVIEKALGK